MKMRWIVVCAALALDGCSVTPRVTVITLPVAVVTSHGETLRGTATSDLFAGGSFEAENARLQCTGKYDISPGSPTVSIATRCTDGTAGVGRAIRDTALSGSGKIAMNDGTEAMFVYGAAANAIVPGPERSHAYAPTTSGATAARATTETLKDEIRLELQGGVYAVPVVINQAVSIPFVVDSGAADVQLPAEVVLTLIRTGSLSEGDFIDSSSYVLANGSTLRSPRFNIREMRVGEHVVRNVAASVGPAIKSEALLGQSFLSKLPSWTLDNQRHVLVMRR